MDAKDLRTESALSDRSKDGNTKYTQDTTLQQCNRNKSYQDIGSSSLGKVDAQTVRPCAVIGPDRVVPPPAAADPYLKKSPLEPWPCVDAYHRSLEHPHKMNEYHLPNRNISPRQTFQENMQRIMLPSYNLTKSKDNFPPDQVNITNVRNTKVNLPTEAKYCEVPYAVNSAYSEQKTTRSADVNVPLNASFVRSGPHGWPPSSNIRSMKPYPEMFQYSEPSNCGASRPVYMPGPHRPLHEEPSPVYPEPYYQEGNIRFKPYPSAKDRVPQVRYEYLGNYSAPFQPSPFPNHKHELQKSIPSHPYSGYPQVPLKYLDSRMAEPSINAYQRPINQQPNCNNASYRNPVIHPSYTSVAGNLQTNKFYPYPPEHPVKNIPMTRLPYDTNNKIYMDYDNFRPKPYAIPDSYYFNEGRSHSIKGQVLPPQNFPLANVQRTRMPMSYYRRDNPTIKGYEYGPHLRSFDPSLMSVHGNTMSRLSSQFSPNNVTMSPSDSSVGNDTTQTHVLSQEDAGYASQSSTASIRSTDAGLNRIPNDPYGRYDYRYGVNIKQYHMPSKSEINSNNGGTKNKKDIDVRQFLQMWNEGEEEGNENNKEVNSKHVNIDMSQQSGTHNQEQLYVLGLVNVPSEELAKYEHIEKVSKLPENIKGYNSIELLNQFEEVIESSKLNNFSPKVPQPRDTRISMRNSQQLHGLNPQGMNMMSHGIHLPPRPLSPLDVEAKISQSVIHKEVGCNFEIKPCSPKILSVEIAAPVQTLLSERVIEKVSNPITAPSVLQSVELENCKSKKLTERNMTPDENIKAPSCKMISNVFNDNVKTNYSLHDLESSSGVCLASLPRLDNDCELNFQEVNQQFINANKETVITSTIKDLPSIEVTAPSVDKNDLPIPPSLDNGKGICKLSKYRKLRTKTESEEKSHDIVSQHLRTDSVIIKNPDNVKSCDEISESVTVMHEKQIPPQSPINLTVHDESRINHIQRDLEVHEVAKATTAVRTAIDYSSRSNDIVKKAMASDEINTIECNLINNIKQHPQSVKSDHTKHIQQTKEQSSTNSKTREVLTAIDSRNVRESQDSSELSSIEKTPKNEMFSKATNGINDFSEEVFAELQNDGNKIHEITENTLQKTTELESRASEMFSNAKNETNDISKEVFSELRNDGNKIHEITDNTLLKTTESEFKVNENKMDKYVEANPFHKNKRLIPGTEFYEEDFSEISGMIKVPYVLKDTAKVSILNKSSCFKKEMFSPQIQLLLMHTEGLYKDIVIDQDLKSNQSQTIKAENLETKLVVKSISVSEEADDNLKFYHDTNMPKFDYSLTAFTEINCEGPHSSASREENIKVIDDSETGADNIDASKNNGDKNITENIGHENDNALIKDSILESNNNTSIEANNLNNDMVSVKGVIPEKVNNASLEDIIENDSVSKKCTTPYNVNEALIEANIPENNRISARTEIQENVNNVPLEGSFLGNDDVSAKCTISENINNSSTAENILDNNNVLAKCTNSENDNNALATETCSDTDVEMKPILDSRNRRSSEIGSIDKTNKTNIDDIQHSRKKLETIEKLGDTTSNCLLIKRTGLDKVTANKAKSYDSQKDCDSYKHKSSKLNKNLPNPLIREKTKFKISKSKCKPKKSQCKTKLSRYQNPNKLLKADLDFVSTFDRENDKLVGDINRVDTTASVTTIDRYHDIFVTEEKKFEKIDSRSNDERDHKELVAYERRIPTVSDTKLDTDNDKLVADAEKLVPTTSGEVFEKECEESIDDKTFIPMDSDTTFDRDHDTFVTNANTVESIASSLALERDHDKSISDAKAVDTLIYETFEKELDRSVADAMAIDTVIKTDHDEAVAVSKIVDTSDYNKTFEKEVGGSLVDEKNVLSMTTVMAFEQDHDKSTAVAKIVEKMDFDKTFDKELDESVPDGSKVFPVPTDSTDTVSEKDYDESVNVAKIVDTIEYDTTFEMDHDKPVRDCKKVFAIISEPSFEKESNKTVAVAKTVDTMKYGTTFHRNLDKSVADGREVFTMLSDTSLKKECDQNLVFPMAPDTAFDRDYNKSVFDGKKFDIPTDTLNVHVFNEKNVLITECEHNINSECENKLKTEYESQFNTEDNNMRSAEDENKAAINQSKPDNDINTDDIVILGTDDDARNSVENISNFTDENTNSVEDENNSKNEKSKHEIACSPENVGNDDNTDITKHSSGSDIKFERDRFNTGNDNQSVSIFENKFSNTYQNEFSISNENTLNSDHENVSLDDENKVGEENDCDFVLEAENEHCVKDMGEETMLFSREENIINTDKYKFYCNIEADVDNDFITAAELCRSSHVRRDSTQNKFNSFLSDTFTNTNIRVSTSVLREFVTNDKSKEIRETSKLNSERAISTRLSCLNPQSTTTENLSKNLHMTINHSKDICMSKSMQSGSVVTTSEESDFEEKSLTNEFKSDAQSRKIPDKEALDIPYKESLDNSLTSSILLNAESTDMISSTSFTEMFIEYEHETIKLMKLPEPISPSNLLETEEFVDQKDNSEDSMNADIDSQNSYAGGNEEVMKEQKTYEMVTNKKNTAHVSEESITNIGKFTELKTEKIITKEENTSQLVSEINKNSREFDLQFSSKNNNDNSNEDNLNTTLIETSDENYLRVSHKEECIILSDSENKLEKQNCVDSSLENNQNYSIHSQQTIQNVEEEKCKHVNYSIANIHSKKRKTLKRSLSDSAINISNEELHESIPWSEKRKRFVEPENETEPQLFTENISINLINNNRRNSVSSFYTDENVSFCILIDDNCIIAEENDEEKICFAEVPEELIACQPSDVDNNEDFTELESVHVQHCDISEYSSSIVLDTEEEERMVEESWFDDVACVETVVSEDIVDDIGVSETSSPINIFNNETENCDNETDNVDVGMNYHCEKVKRIYGEKMCSNDAEFVDTLYRTPQMDMNRTLVSKDSEDCNGYYNIETLEEVLSEANTQEQPLSTIADQSVLCHSDDQEQSVLSLKHAQDEITLVPSIVIDDDKEKIDLNLKNINDDDKSIITQDDTVNSCESSVDLDFNKKECTSISTVVSSSPEVSSTTEEKNSSILLKITTYGVSRIAEVDNISREETKKNTVSCKYTENREYLNYNNNVPRPLITKAAQKYIPPLVETVKDLKVKLRLPQQSLNKLKQLKLSKEEPKLDLSKPNLSDRDTIKKPKPKFEDVLASIDEIQYKMHKEKSKKVKKVIPKVVIKKSENGSHYASTAERRQSNPDLTGQKWQPWVFLERNRFIDKMAIKNKTKAIYNHRKNMYILAETFKKYKSDGGGVNETKHSFVISQQTLNDSASGKLKYTIRLKQAY